MRTLACFLIASKYNYSIKRSQKRNVNFKRRKTMSNALSNLQSLRFDMKEKGWCVTGFPFIYKQEKYSVVLELLEKPYEKFYTMLLTFHRSDGEEKPIYAHSNGLNLKGFKLSDFFGSEYRGGYEYFTEYFYARLNEQVPTHMPSTLNKEIKTLCEDYLSQKDGDDINKKYCYKAAHNGKVNGKQKYRTRYNSDKTKLLYPDIYNALGKDKTISFYYSSNPLDEKSKFEIIRSLSKSYN